MRRSCVLDKEMRHRIADLAKFLQFNGADVVNILFLGSEWQFNLPRKLNMLV